MSSSHTSDDSLLLASITTVTTLIVLVTQIWIDAVPVFTERGEGVWANVTGFLTHIIGSDPAKSSSTLAPSAAAAGMRRLRVLVVDDNADAADTLVMLLGASGHEMRTAYNGVAALRMAHEFRPDVVLCDIRMPCMDGLAVLTELQASGDATPVIMLTTFNTDDYVVRAFQLGAAGFLLKDADPREMVAAVRDVHAGRPALSAGAVETLIGTVHSTPARDHRARALVDTLTEREREVAVLLASGASNADIARQSHMAVATVKANMSRIFTKLGVDNRVSAAMLIRDAGLA